MMREARRLSVELLDPDSIAAASRTFETEPRPCRSGPLIADVHSSRGEGDEAEA